MAPELISPGFPPPPHFPRRVTLATLCLWLLGEHGAAHGASSATMCCRQSGAGRGSGGVLWHRVTARYKELQGPALCHYSISLLVIALH